MLNGLCVEGTFAVVIMPDIKTKSRSNSNKVNSRNFGGNHLKKDIENISHRASKFRNNAVATEGPILRTGDQTGDTGSQHLTAENHTPDNNNQQTGKVHF